MMKKTPPKAHLVGIKGVAMTALAVYLKEKGYLVTGSDVEEKFSTDPILDQIGIRVLHGFAPQHINKDINLVVVTGAHGGATNPEALQAKKMQIPTFMHGRYLGMLMNDKFGIAVSGCHGKTSTASMIALILKEAGYDPSYSIGTAFINNIGPAGHYGQGKFFIAEADEYMTCPLTDRTPRFLWLNPKIAVITNIEFDHPDSFSDLAEVKKAYLDFSQKLDYRGTLIVCLDNPVVADMIDKFKSSRVITYGFSPTSDYRIEKYFQSGKTSFVAIESKNIRLGELIINVAGRHNLLNALAASIIAQEVGLPWNKIREYLKKYTGCNRRFELIGQKNNILLYDDYAHHPSEIKATLSAFKDWYPDYRLTVIFQPHTFSRTKILLEEFVSSFIKADDVLIADIFPSAREKFDKSINSLDVVAGINRLRNNAYYVKNQITALKLLKNKLTAQNIIVTMGAGNLNKWHPSILNLLKEQ
ncbi:UDP-N-acetylmuramate--L-alanine ligase [Candidatus Gottesmanbacteria bacterium RIFCSPHIGHO2_02_FULL_39_14]|uniref:UDP-N-acetylmuramate--L-alanine ligase n=2 Tax=Candidatus Gottesmaniibacteriota TaxID=1752720 RepID=A0A1F6A018_9BACT|nr:MAG: UDP-N-acetylmuramate--L-alanine ligase [Candidatus Gottesmanbacteria bacterium RIFCSPHIGHO2_02_FULL_39_14]